MLLVEHSRQCPLNTRILKGSSSAWSRRIKACTMPKSIDRVESQTSYDARLF